MRYYFHFFFGKELHTNQITVDCKQRSTNYQPSDLPMQKTNNLQNKIFCYQYNDLLSVIKTNNKRRIFSQ